MGDRVGDSLALGEPVETRATDRSGDVNDELRRCRRLLGDERQPARRWPSRPRPACARPPRGAARATAATDERPPARDVAGRACLERARETRRHGGCTRLCGESVPVSSQTTKFTSLPGTTIVFRGSPPFRCACTRSDARASATSSSSPIVARHLEAVAQLSVHLQHDLDGLALEHRRVRDGPRVPPQALAAEPLPELLGEMRRVGLDQRDGGLRGEAGGGVVGRAADLVDELHHRGDRGVEREAPVDVVGDLGDRLVRLARQRRVRRARRQASRPARAPPARAGSGSARRPRRPDRATPCPGRRGP